MTPDPNIERLDEDWTPVYEHVPPHPMCCDECKQARADLEAAREALREAVSLLRAVVEADKQDALMGHPNPGDSCIAAVIGLAVMEWLESPSSALAAPDSEPTQFCGRDDLVPHRWHHWRRMADGSYGDYDDDGVLMRCPGLVAPDPEGDDRG